MPLRIGTNGFGRMGRLALRAGWDSQDLQFVHVNETAGVAGTAAHLLTFDSAHGRWPRRVEGGGDRLSIDGTVLAFSAAARPGEVPWLSTGVDVVLLGYEERPLLPVDYKDDPRSAVVDALSTMVVDGTCVKVLVWYDDEIGYVHRMIELVQKVGAALGRTS
jgi:glyceraldehyde-3-phosphate dehydrogenase/erythrose-4-phosphate dehydrogenase